MKKTSILYAEDSAIIAMAMEGSLESLGYQITEAATSVEKLAALETADYDVALLDLNIVGGDTIATGERLLARGIPIVFLSGSSLPGRVWSKGSVFLLKPASLGEIDRALKDAIKMGV